MMNNQLRRASFMLNVTKTARLEGMTRTEFMNLAKIAWDALEKSEAAVDSELPVIPPLHEPA